MDLYNEKINEFVNWQTSRNELTGVSLSGEDMPVSGGSIRNLLVEHLQKPFVWYLDTDDNKIKFFTSELARRLYLEHKNEDDNQKYLDLVVYSMTKPNDYTIDINDAFLQSGIRYVTAGDPNQEGLKMSYTWDVKLGDRSEVDNLLVTYVIQCPSGKVHQTAESKNYGDRLNTTKPLSLYPYLESGTNQVDVRFKAQKTGAEKNIRIFITVVEFNLQSSFQYYNKVEVGDSFTIPVVLNRNVTSQSANIYVNIDGQLAAINGQNAGLPYTVNAGVTGTIYLNISNAEDQETGIRPYRGSTAGEDITHTVQIWAETALNDTTFRSNLLYYTFEIKAATMLSNKFINVGMDYSNAQVSIYPLGSLIIYGIQYTPVTVPWGYYTDSESYDTAITVDWKIEHNGSYSTVASLRGEKGIKPSNLTFIPNMYSTGDSTYLCAYHNNELLLRIPMVIQQGSADVVTPNGMALELSAYSKSNNTDDKDQWNTTGTSAQVTLSSGIQYNATSGWNDHALRISGTSEYATVDYNIFDESVYTIQDDGRTIEFEFESERVNDDNDVIMMLGKPNEARIEVTPNSATLFDNSDNMVIKTNFKSNERVKLCFILNPASNTSDNQLVYIVTNGILERASQGGASFRIDSGGTIKIGGSQSGIKFYNMRIYNYAISYTNAYNNYVYDSEDKGTIIANNNIMKNGVIDYDACCAKLDTFLIEGSLDALLSGTTDKNQSTTNAKITRVCPYDSTKNFTVIDSMIRKHGQSTLSYPITSMKFWLNKKFQPENENDIPRFTCEGQVDLGLAKNRYKMKDDSIPANKFVLQANYADSSGVHNGGLERLINDTWYRAQVDGKYVLRTEPQLVASIGSNEKDTYGLEHVWRDYIQTSFPTPIRVAPDSVPCVVFYKNGEGEVTYLGQYVFMEDKKSDFNYGERSIYKADPSDPFCLKTENKKADTAANRIWDNDDVLRIEVLDINNVFTSYMSWTKDGQTFDADIPEEVEETTDPETGIVTRSVKERHYHWEESFEMIYPDPGDIEPKTADEEKFGVQSKFVRKAQPFIDWVKWLTDCRNNYNIATRWWDAGTYSSAQDAFDATAEDHLDLYKMAAYYIFMLRFGLVDSGERNVQIKTYDGVHFHYEPWDMDIAMGNRNDGGIAFNPPVDRTTRLGNGYAISGKSAVTSNFLWDALEGNTNWANVIVPKVAQALHTAGLDYDTCAEMFDENYAEKWSEILYNKSGYYKYITRGGGSQMYLNWLQGARMLHRHWWLSTSMNYYDAKWGVGSFNDSRVDLFAGHQGTEGSTEYVTIYPTSSTFFKMVVNQNATDLGTKSATRINPAQFNVGPVTFQAKTPTYIYGANFIEKLDLSVIAPTLARVTLGGAYDKVLGAPIKELNVGCPITQVTADQYTGQLNIADPGNIETTVGESEDRRYPLTNLQTLNIRGQLGQGSETGNFYTTFSMLRDNVDARGDLSQVKNLYAMGSGIVNFMSAAQGNQFDNLELPDTIYSLNFNNTTWNNFSFWHTTVSGSNATHTRYNVGGDSLLWVPSGLREVVFNGTTGHTLNSKQFVMAWINGIIEQLGANPTDAQIEEALSSKTLRMDDIKWDTAALGAANLLTYDELILLSKIGTKDLKGYIMLASGQSQLTSEQLTRLTQLFGNDIFTYSSSGLIIDYDLNTTIISISGDITVDGNNEVHLKEGHSAILNATRFHLNNEVNNVTWTIRERVLDGGGNPIETIPGDMVRSCILDTSNPRQILLKAINSENSAYSIFVHASLGNAEIVVHIDPTDYPVLAIEPTENRARVGINDITLYGGNVNDNFAVVTKSAVAGAAEIQGISWGIRLEDGTNAPIDLVTDPTNYKMVNNSTILNYKRGNSRFDIRLNAGIPISDENIYNYTLVATINLGGKTQTLTKKIIVMNDQSPIVRADGSYLYLALNALYTSLNGEGTEAFYRSTLMGLTGTLDFSPYPNLAILSVSTNKSIFYYLTGITGVILDECSLLTSTFNNAGITINQTAFDNMPNLQTLSIQGCTGLTEDIDLSMCENITSVDASGTNINVLIPENSGITTYELGMPTQVSIINPTDLTASGILVDGYKNITDLEIIKSNSQRCNAYSMFAKVMNRRSPIIKDRIYGKQFNSTNNTISDTDNQGYWITSKIDLNNTNTIFVAQSQTIYNWCFIVFYNSQDNVTRAMDFTGAVNNMFGSNSSISVQTGEEYIRLVSRDSSLNTPNSYNIVDNSGNLLYTWRNNI